MRVFVSYRREDAAPWAGRLHDALAARFGERNIFQDVVAVRPGEDFTDAIDRALADCDVTLVVIGPRWLTATGADGERRLARPDDHVRSEVIAALNGDAPVVPVLVGGATMPAAADLPAGLEPLAQRQAVALDDATWPQDVDALVRGLQRDSDRRRRRGPLAVTAAAVAAVAVGLGVWWAGRDDGDDDDDTGGDALDLTGCPTPTEPEWTLVAEGGATTVDDPASAWRYEVLQAATQQDDDGDWPVVITVAATNETGTIASHDAGFYELVVDGVEFIPECFSIVAGRNPLDPASTNEALVGFELLREPAGDLAVDVRVRTDGTQERITLTAPAG